MENCKPSPSKWKYLQSISVKVSLWLINTGLFICSRLLWPRFRPKDAQRVLIYRIGNIGDLTCSLPAMQAVRRTYPEAHLTLLTSPGRATLPGAKDLLPDIKWINEILIYGQEDIATFKGQLRLLMLLRKQHFDVWIHLPANLASIRRELRDMSFARLTGVRWARGWSISTLQWAAQAQSEYIKLPTEVDRLNMIVEYAGFSTVPVDFGLPRTEAVKRRIDTILPTNNVSGWVILAPGCKRSTNRWPTEHFANVGKFLSENGLGILLLGGESDAPECDQIAEIIGNEAISLAGQLTLPESIEVLRRCRLAICVDSGVQHLASAVGTPTLSLFSFWQMPGKWFPYGSENTVLQHWVPCHTCLLTECPNKNQCMTLIKADEVIQQAIQKLNLERKQEHQL